MVDFSRECPRKRAGKTQASQSIHKSNHSSASVGVRRLGKTRKRQCTLLPFQSPVPLKLESTTPPSKELYATATHFIALEFREQSGRWATVGHTRKYRLAWWCCVECRSLGQEQRTRDCDFYLQNSQPRNEKESQYFDNSNNGQPQRFANPSDEQRQRQG